MARLGKINHRHRLVPNFRRPGYTHPMSDQNLYIVLGIVGAVLAAALFFFLRRRPSSPGTHQSVRYAPPSPASPSATQQSVRSAPAAPAPKRDLTVGLSKSAQFLQGAIDKLFSHSEGAAFFSDLEETLVTADLGIEFTERLVTSLRKDLGLKVPSREELKARLSQALNVAFPELPLPTALDGATLPQKPWVIMMVGVNGVGKTTTTGKLCSRFRAQNRKVIVGAADTFRAAASEQLQAWVERTGAEGVFQKEGADPAAVAFDAVQAAQNRGADVCIVDTAGRLHTKHNLMDELAKVKRVMAKASTTGAAPAPHEVWLTVDGTTGQNALHQAREFHKALTLTGIVITKLDGSARGGIVIPIVEELKVPVVLVGVGEGVDDLLVFDRTQFLQGLLAAL